jgi:hypothetical protein
MMPAPRARVHLDAPVRPSRLYVTRPCGAEETRTPDFLLAKEALYQLSYGPRGTRSILLLVTRGPTERGR